MDRMWGSEEKQGRHSRNGRKVSKDSKTEASMTVLGPGAGVGVEGGVGKVRPELEGLECRVEDLDYSDWQCEAIVNS